MDNLINRYVYDVTHRLPEKDRDEVRKELQSNIYDMLSENADDDEIKTVLYKLGAPADLAEKYRQKPRYLISPAVYEYYIQTLKWLLPLAGSIGLVVGMVSGSIDAIRGGSAEAVWLTQNIVSAGISMGLSAAAYALIWTTIGFIIADRTNLKSSRRKEREWKVEDLSEVLPTDKKKIPLSDGIAGLVLTLLFSAIGILLCAGTVPIIFRLQAGDTQIITPFDSSFLAACIPAIIILGLFGAMENIIKIKERRWTPLVCTSVIVKNIANIGVMIYLINRPNIFSTELTAFLQNIDWVRFSIPGFIGNREVNPIIALIFIITIIFAFVECISAIFKTFKSKNL
ncbi:MAG: hypothetical protein QM793_00765 [Muricomes sp.]